MQAGARLAALIEIMDALLADWQQGEQPLPAEHHLRYYTRNRRYIGSKDRRYLQESLFSLLRQFGGLRYRIEQSGLPITGRLVVLGWQWLLLQAQSTASNANIDAAPLDIVQSLFSGVPYHPAPLDAEELTWLATPLMQPGDAPLSPAASANLPDWLYQRLEQHYGPETTALCAALQQPAPVDLRVNLLRTTPEKLRHTLAEQGIALTPIEGIETAFTTASGQDLAASDAFDNGWFEIQDRGSQQILTELPLKPGMTILDYCAGAGGKSLALASTLGNQAEILAYDISRERLEQLAIRAKRAGADCIRIMYRPEDLSSYAQSADIVLVDAPCSGTGTLRRHPDLAWRISPEKLDRYNEIQRQILVDATRFVAPEGFLFYVTCSLLTQENEGIIHSFLASHPDFRIVGMPEMWIMDVTRMPDRRLEPHRHQSDGFFGILLKRSSAR